MATLARVTPAVIGLTVVAAGTSVPELAVSLIAALRGSEAIAVGNVVGSNIFNITFILGLAAVIRPLAISGNTIRLEYPVLALVTLLGLAVCDDGRISRLDATLFLAIYVCFTAYLVTLVREQMNEAEVKGLRTEVKELAQTAGPRPRAWASIALVAGGVGLLVAGAHATVSGAIELGRILGMSERVIGLTIVAAGTGLPEVVTSLVSSPRARRRRHRQRHRLEPLQHPRHAGDQRPDPPRARAAGDHRGRQLVDAGRHPAALPADVHQPAGRPLGGRPVAGDLRPVPGPLAGPVRHLGLRSSRSPIGPRSGRSPVAEMTHSPGGTPWT